MTLIGDKKVKFTPEVLITAPRRSAAYPNTAGTHAIYTISSYDLEAHQECKETRIFKIDDLSTTLFSTNSGDTDPQWLGDTNQIIYQRSNDSEETELWIANGISEKRAYFAGKIATAIGDVKTVQLENGNIGLVFTAPTNPKGQVFNPKSVNKPKHTGKDYTTHPVRAWDAWNPTHRFSLYFTIISKQSDGRWKLSNEEPINALKGTKIQFPRSPGAVLGENGSYTVGCRGILLCAPDPGQNIAFTLNFSAYIIALTSFEEKNPKCVRIRVPEYIGSTEYPAVSKDGSLAAFVVARTECSMKCERAIAIFSMVEESTNGDSHAAVKLLKFTDSTKTAWDRLAGDLHWSHDLKTLYIESEDLGYDRLFKLDLPPLEKETQLVDAPKLLSNNLKGSISAVSILAADNKSGTSLFITSSSYTEPSLYSILDASSGEIRTLSSISNNGADLGLSESQYESITFPGDKSSIQAFIIRPSYFDPEKKYPVALLIHGGPQGAWTNSWSTRWNAAVWAEQGYIVLLPNPSGSTGFGLELMSSVLGDWGGRPYRDIEKAVDYISTLDYVDSSNITMAGGSYGGYMAFWIAGQPLAQRLRAIVSHHGVFHAASMFGSDFVYDLGIEVGSQLWHDIHPWEKWSPANYARNWNTPMLIIHSDLDYRCPVSEGLGAYGVLQAKGVDSRFLCFEDENHWVLKRENSLKWWNTVLGWFNRYSGVEGGVELEAANCDARFEEEDGDEEAENGRKGGKEVNQE